MAPENPGDSSERSDLDAIGLDKRREVIGGNYGASAKRQVTVYLGAIAVAVLLVIGAIVLVGQLDKGPDTVEAQAPWAQDGAEQVPVGPIDQ